jgi:undecaprenyl-diphosphatase
MEFLYLLEKIRLPGLNEFMLAITTLGEETALLVIALILFWCVDKRRGYYILSVGLLGTVFNQFVKLVCRVPRPWVRDPNFTILEQAREGASGFSFPSGHTQTAVGLFGGVAITTKRRLICAIALILAVLVGFSRMYIGVHTPADVLVGAAQSVFLLVVMHPLIFKKDGKLIPWAFGGMILISALFLAYVEGLRAECFTPDEDIAHNISSGIKNAYTLLGCTSGLLVVWIVDRKLDFATDAVWWAQLIKAGVGLLLVLAVKEGLRSPLDAMFAGHLAARAVRYFCIVIVAGIVWPLSFKLFPKKEVAK